MSLKHEEATFSGKYFHKLTIVSMVQQLERYLNLFDEQPAKNFKTGEFIEENIIKDLLNSSFLGENLLLELINKCLLSSNEKFHFFFPITN